MYSSNTREMIGQVDKVLSGGELGAATVDGLREILYPEGSREHWPDVPVVIHLLEQEVIKGALEKSQLSTELAELLLALIAAITPLLGYRPVGPLAHQVEQFRQRYEREERKYHLVADRVGTRPMEVVIPMVMAYLEMSPAPFFAMRLRRHYAAVVAQAEQALKEEADRWLEDGELLDLLERVEGDEAQIVGELIPRLEALKASPLGDYRSVKRGVSGEDGRAQLVAGALAVYAGHHDLAAYLLEHVVLAKPYAPQLAVFSALLEADLTREGLAAFLFDLVWGNPEEPEAQWTEARQRAALAARAVLPHVGSPLPAVEGLPETTPKVPEQVEWLFGLWRGLLKQGRERQS